jgi:hypothetical protein
MRPTQTRSPLDHHHRHHQQQEEEEVEVEEVEVVEGVGGWRCWAPREVRGLGGGQLTLRRLLLMTARDGEVRHISHHLTR